MGRVGISLGLVGLLGCAGGAEPAEAGDPASGGEVVADVSEQAPPKHNPLPGYAGEAPEEHADASGRIEINVEDWLIEPAMVDRPQASFSCPDSVDALSLKLVRDDMAAHETELAQCTVDNRVGEGRISVSFMVGVDGMVESVHPEEEVELESVAACFEKVFARIDFCPSTHTSKITTHYVIKRRE
jgi:hypothetical protein